jgi:hypothetical protein
MRKSIALAGHAMSTLGLLGGAAYFLWAFASHGAVPLFLAFAIAFGVAARGVQLRRYWAPGYATGLSLLTLALLAPLRSVPEVTVLFAALCTGLVSLGARALADRGPRVDWRLSSLGLSAGLATPFLLLYGLTPMHLGVLGVGSLLAVALASVGFLAAFRGRTWGLFALLAAVPLLSVDTTWLEVGGVVWHCGLARHDAAGDAAAALVLFALLPFAAPVVRFLARR